MGDAAYYRNEARRCRAQAASAPNGEAARRWLRLAADYDHLAEALENNASAPQGSMQPQPVQQQQKKAEDET